MKVLLQLLIILLGLLSLQPVRADNGSYSSTATRNSLLELYTSEGCSSCPPAEAWLSKLKNDTRLWQTLFPVAFHVDYWDKLGWQDSYSDRRFSRRQRIYVLQGYAGTVYTPGFFHNGREWRGYFNQANLNTTTNDRTGILSAELNPEQLDVIFRAEHGIQTNLLHVAALGINRTTVVYSGENTGKTLHHDFVVLGYQQYFANDNRWHITDRQMLRRINRSDAVVFWTTTTDDPMPVQTTGGWLNKKGTAPLER